MGESRESEFERLKALLERQRLAVLATQRGGHPYTSLVAFAASSDMRRIVFVTSRATTKYRNLSAEPFVSMLIDSRTHSVEDFADAAAATAVGRVTVLAGRDAPPLLEPFLQRHPHLETFARSPSTALCCVDVVTYYLVTRFQNVVEMDVHQWPSSNP